MQKNCLLVGSLQVKMWMSSRVRTGPTRNKRGSLWRLVIALFPINGSPSSTVYRSISTFNQVITHTSTSIQCTNKPNTQRRIQKFLVRDNKIYKSKLGESQNFGCLWLMLLTSLDAHFL